MMTENAQYDPDYEVPTEIGLMVVRPVKTGLELLVLFDMKGVPVTIDHAIMGAVTAIVIGQNHKARLNA
jgi:hypothetical protein